MEKKLCIPYYYMTSFDRGLILEWHAAT